MTVGLEPPKRTRCPLYFPARLRLVECPGLVLFARYRPRPPVAAGVGGGTLSALRKPIISPTLLGANKIWCESFHVGAKEGWKVTRPILSSGTKSHLCLCQGERDPYPVARTARFAAGGDFQGAAQTSCSGQRSQ